MQISLMTIEDYESAYRLWTNTDGMGLRSLDDSLEGITKFIQRNPNTNFVCREDGKLVGVILCGHDGRRAYIYHAVVDPNQRGKGIGKQLVDKVIDALKLEGINKACLVVFSDNAIGNNFWDAIGFHERTDLVYRNKSINDMNI